MTVEQVAASKNSRADQTPPGPKRSLLSTLLGMRNGQTLEGVLNTWKQYGDIVFAKLGPIRNYMFFNPEHVYQVLVTNQKNYIKGLGYNGFRLLAGQGLVTS